MSTVKVASHADFSFLLWFLYYFLGTDKRSYVFNCLILLVDWVDTFTCLISIISYTHPTPCMKRHTELRGWLSKARVGGQEQRRAHLKIDYSHSREQEVGGRCAFVAAPNSHRRHSSPQKQNKRVNRAHRKSKEEKRRSKNSTPAFMPFFGFSFSS